MGGDAEPLGFAHDFPHKAVSLVQMVEGHIPIEDGVQNVADLAIDAAGVDFDAIREVPHVYFPDDGTSRDGVGDEHHDTRAEV